MASLTVRRILGEAGTRTEDNQHSAGKLPPVDYSDWDNWKATTRETINQPILSLKQFKVAAQGTRWDGTRIEDYLDAGYRLTVYTRNGEKFMVMVSPEGETRALNSNDDQVEFEPR